MTDSRSALLGFRILLLVFAVALLFGAAREAAAITVQVDTTVGSDGVFIINDPDQPQGVAVGEMTIEGTPTEVLFVAEGGTCTDCRIYVYDLATGGQLGSFSSGYEQLRGLETLPNGNLLLTTLNFELDTFSRNRRAVEIEVPMSFGGIATQTGINLLLQQGSAGGDMPEPAGIVVIDMDTILIGQPGDYTDPGFIRQININPDRVSFTTDGDIGFVQQADYAALSGLELIPGTRFVFAVDDGGGAASGLFVYRLATTSPLDGSLADSLGDPVLVPVDPSDPDFVEGAYEFQVVDGTCTASCLDPQGLAFADPTDPTDPTEPFRLYVLFPDGAGAQKVVAFEVRDVVPEPSSSLLLGVGLAGLTLLRRRRASRG